MTAETTLVTPALNKGYYTISFWYFIPGSTSKLDVFAIDVENHSKHVFSLTEPTNQDWMKVKHNVSMENTFTVCTF